MDNSYPVTPYPLSPYGAATANNADPTPNCQQQQARQLMAYLIAPPINCTVPPSQAATIAGEPVMVQPANEEPQPMNYSPSAYALPTQPITSPLAGKPHNNFSSYEPLPSMPNMVPIVSVAASPQPAGMMRQARMRPATDMSVLPHSPYYHHLMQQQHQYEQLCPLPQTQEDSKPAAANSKQPVSLLKRALSFHTSFYRIMLPYWMLLSVGLLIAVVVLLGRVAAATKQFGQMELVVEPKIVQMPPVVAAPAPVPVPQRPVVRARGPIHSAPLPHINA